MGVLIVDAKVKAEIAAMIERARAKPVPLSVVREGAIPGDKTEVTLADRKPGFERLPSQHIILGSYRAAFSIEEQPHGFCRHLSISARRPGSVPNIPVIEKVAKLFGFVFEEVVDPPVGRVWLEEFEPGHHAVNIIQLIGERTEGHA
jgi:hypothetical protein